MWSWLEVFPQHVFCNAQGEKEQMSVGVAQNAVGTRLATLSEPGARGRNFHGGANDPSPNAVLYGLNFAEQFERALQEDPQFLFVTGWNEWYGGRFDEFLGVRMPVMFVDTYNQVNSRDIEPMKAGHGDNYYYQLAAFIRRYKGVREMPVAGPKMTLDWTDFSAWERVQPEFRDDAGDPCRRDHPGYDPATRYVNDTGRNDFELLKVAHDDEHLFFYARTHEPITPHTDRHWMMLFIDADGDPKSGWEGYNFVVNRTVKDGQMTTLERSKAGWAWRCEAEVSYCVKGCEMALAIPRRALGLHHRRKPLRFSFKWMDNMQIEGDINEFTLNGDAAPNGRFKYRYLEAAK